MSLQEETGLNQPLPSRRRGKRRWENFSLSLSSLIFALRQGIIRSLNDSRDTLADIRPFVHIYWAYLQKKTRNYAWRFETVKDFLFSFLFC